MTSRGNLVDLSIEYGVGGEPDPPERLSTDLGVRISSFPERSSGKEREELCRSAVLWAFNTVRLYGFRVDRRGGSGSFRLIER